MEKYTINSSFDKLALSSAVFTAKKPKAIIFFFHGMAEHKERYYNLMEYLSKNGYTCVIHDHRGHGESVKDNSYGDFYTNSYKPLVEDALDVMKFYNDMMPGLDNYIFAHSMGTLVARCFLQRYDNLVKKVILCGAPTKNSGAKLGLSLAKRAYKSNKNEPAYRINKLAFSKQNSLSKVQNGWICANLKEVEAYNNDPLCGFVFKPSGFIGLFGMMVDAFKAKLYQAKNKELKIYLIGGANDSIINGYRKFNKLAKFLNKVGYNNLTKQLYAKMRHEIINEAAKALVYQDILKFYNN